MLGQVSSNNQDELIKPIEVRDLSMRSNNIPIDASKHPHILKQSDSTPEASFFTPWFRTDLGFFRIHLTVVGPETEQPKGDFTLSRSKAKSALKAMTNVIELAEKKLW